MLNKKTRSESPSGSFWDWIAANTERIRAEAENHSLMEEMGRVFRRYHPGLAWEIGPIGSETLTFYVSADGRKSLFARVQKVVGSAPAVPGWEVRAFKPRCPLEEVCLKFGDHELTYDDVWFTAEPAGRRAQVTLFVRGWSEEPDSALSTGVDVLLDNAVGEYDAAMRVTVLECRSLEELPPDGAFPLSELPGYLDRQLPPGGPD